MAGEEFDELIESVFGKKEDLQEALEDAKKWIKKHPLAAVGIAAATGYIAHSLLGGKK